MQTSSAQNIRVGFKKLLLPVAAVICVCIGLLLAKVRMDFFYPKSLIPLRHYPSVDVAKDLDLKTLALEQLHIRDEIAVPDELLGWKSLNEQRLPTGLNLFIGTYGLDIRERSLRIQFVFSDSIVECRSRRAVDLKDNQLVEIVLDCPNQRVAINWMDFRALRLRFEHHAADEMIAIYAKACQQGACSQNAKPAAILPVFSLYPNDTPSFSFLNALDYGEFWNPVFFQVLFFFSIAGIGILLAGFLLSSWGLMVDWKQTSPERIVIWSSLGAVLWALLALSFIWVTPPFQNPDEPQHLKGLARMQLAPGDREIADQVIRKIAGQVSFLEVEKHPATPIVRGLPQNPDLGQYGFDVIPSARSKIYDAYTRFAMPLAWHAFQRRLLPTNNFVVYARLAIAIPALALVALGLGFHILTRAHLAICVLFTSLFLPVSLSLVSSVSNYGLAIVWGSLFASLLVPEGSFKLANLRMCAAVFVLVFLGDSAIPALPLLFLAPPCLVALSVWNAWNSKIEKGSRSFWLSVLVVPVSVLLAYALFVWLANPNLLDPYAARLGAWSANQGARLAFLTKSWVVSVLSLAALTLFSLSLHVLFIRHRVIPMAQSGSDSSSFRWALTLVFLFLLCLSIFLFNFFWPEVRFAPNIYGMNLDKPPFREFLGQCVAAIMSQAVHYEQDYFLWQTNFLAYGWLDTTAPQGYYFILRQLWQVGLVCCALAAIWRTTEFLLLCLPWLIFGGLYWIILLWAAWEQSHTLVGRYLLPAWGLYAIPPLLGCSLIGAGLNRDWRDLAKLLLAFLILFFLISSIWGMFSLIPTRFLIGV
ncbi:MAG TPA: hypothetical protein VE954_08840 [Oligoflexus sp.]|uniref:hypothetical protein n=1 Tax=Oligoflexus sp. TaxID=1971216 RepID=UPI002D6D2F6B|nr:hypothetical protein [Oligoflexus sp.]HYX33209.1 hypothetical protein [Oligoflexus sp.]